MTHTRVTHPDTHQISEIAPGVFWALLEPCSCRVLPHLLRPEPASVVWLVGYRPHAAVEWIDLPLPLSPGGAAETLRARDAAFDLQLPLAAFLTRLPAMHAKSGMTALQMARPVPDTLSHDAIKRAPDGGYGILRRNGWLVTFELPHDGEYAEVVCPDRAHLERILADPVIASRKLP